MPSMPHHPARSAHARAARRRRGAALLEGLAVAAACIGLFSLGLAVHRREAERLEHEREARRGAWQRAAVGCGARGRVGELARAALDGRAAAEAERLAARVRTLGADARRAPLAPCNEPAPLEDPEWSRAESYLERELLPLLP